MYQHKKNKGSNRFTRAGRDFQHGHVSSESLLVVITIVNIRNHTSG